MVLYDKRTLIVRHLPSNLSRENKIEFLKFFGAEEVKFISHKNTKGSTVFAKFSFDHEAEAALRKLHQAELFDQLLSVEFARGSDLNRNISLEKERENEIKEEQSMQRKYLDNFLQKLNSWTNHLDFNQPPPVYLKYQYPPPTLQVLTNIAKVLASVPKFYTQVLHLMNKMNLPCPFSEHFMVESDIIPLGLQEEIFVSENKQMSSEEESEIESEEDVKKDISTVTLKRKVTHTKKMVKKAKLLKKSTVQITKPKLGLKTEDVFEKGQIEVPKKIELKVSSDLKRLENEKEEIIGEGFEKVMPVLPQEEITCRSESSEDNKKTFISSEELAANKISPKDQHILPVFKNYQSGVPSCRLYIKNLAKLVTKEDLHYIYRRYVLPITEEQGQMYDIQLLQEGRMKGQAFISLQNIDQAKLALSETNGYILKGKPMVVQYARSSKPK